MTDNYRRRTLAAIPHDVLFVQGPRNRAGNLLRWCESRNFRPTLAELEDERERRRALDRGETA